MRKKRETTKAVRSSRYHKGPTLTGGLLVIGVLVFVVIHDEISFFSFFGWLKERCWISFSARFSMIVDHLTKEFKLW